MTTGVSKARTLGLQFRLNQYTLTPAFGEENYALMPKCSYENNETIP
jgi:hypothetical protein